MVNQMKLKDSNTKLISGTTNQIASSNLHEPVFSLGVAKWRNTDGALVSFESISLRLVIFLKITLKLIGPYLINFVFCRMADFYLEIEQEIVLRLFEFCKVASSRLQNRASQYMDPTQNLFFPDTDFSGETTKNALYSARLDEKQSSRTDTTLLNEDNKTSFFLPLMVPIGAPWQQIHLGARKQRKIYVELFDMGPIKLTLRLANK